eukprot:4165811-Ditylum_brightwellii.AAC.1
MDSSDVNDVKDIFSCDAATAQHYLRIFGNNKGRAIQSVISYGEDPSWWGHPWNSNVTMSEGVEEMKEDSAIDDGFKDDCMTEHDDGYTMTSDETSANMNESMSQGEQNYTNEDLYNNYEIDKYDKKNLYGGDINAANLVNDHNFYKEYGELVDSFVDT